MFINSFILGIIFRHNFSRIQKKRSLDFFKKKKNSLMFNRTQNLQRLFTDFFRFKNLDFLKKFERINNSLFLKTFSRGKDMDWEKFQRIIFFLFLCFQLLFKNLVFIKNYSSTVYLLFLFLKNYSSTVNLLFLQFLSNTKKFNF